MQIYVDLDNTLCNTDGTNYESSTPIKDRIDQINKLYEYHTITIYTARGSLNRRYCETLTKRQLEEWGIKYHYLSVGEKPVYDLLIDDRNICLNELDGGNLEYLYCRSEPNHSGTISN